MAKRKIGKVVHYYDKIKVAIVELKFGLSHGDEIEINSKFGEFSQKVNSMEIEHKKVKKAKKGDSIGIKVDQKVKEGDEVYKVS